MRARGRRWPQHTVASRPQWPKALITASLIRLSRCARLFESPVTQKDVVQMYCALILLADTGTDCNRISRRLTF